MTKQSTRSEKADFSILVPEAAKRLVRGAGFLDAYRKRMNLILRTSQSDAAKSLLASLVEKAQLSFPNEAPARHAYDHAARVVMESRLGSWLACELSYAAPSDVGEGDEYYSRFEIAEIVERHRGP